MTKLFIIIFSSAFFVSCQMKDSHNRLLQVGGNTNLSITSVSDTFKFVIDSEIQNQFHTINWMENPEILNITKEDINSLREFFKKFQNTPQLIEELRSRNFYYVILASLLFEYRYEGDLILYDIRSVFFQKEWISNRKNNFGLSENVFVENTSRLMQLIIKTNKNFNVNNEHFMKIETVRLSDDELLEYFF